MTAKQGTRHHSNGNASSGKSNDSARRGRALQSAARWLQRRGKQREQKETQVAYREAAALINDLAKGK
jgi:hypothetical protein